MEIKYKLYPYPVLSPYSNDYENVSFDVSVDPVKDGYDIRLDFMATLNCPSLQECINNGRAKYVYHLECAQTGFRTVVQTDSLSEVYILPSKKINGKVQICPFIVAVSDLYGYSSTSFHKDYQDLSFDIEAGCVMAVGKMTIVDITKNIDDIANVPSIFSIIKNSDLSCKQMQVDTNQRKIIIKLPECDFYNYQILSTNHSISSILNSIAIIPALVYVLDELRTLSIDERKENSGLTWYKVLFDTLLKNFDCNIESEEFDDENMLSLAQRLINNPVSEALTSLRNSTNSDGDDE